MNEVDTANIGEKVENGFEKTIRPPGRFSLNFGELWQYRELFFFFAWRDIKVKYKQTLLGFLWAVLQPFLMMMIFVFFFSRMLKIPTDDLPPPIFYFSGLLLWNLFASSLSSAANSMVENAEIIKKIYFPRLIIPLSSVLVALFDFLMAFLIFIGILIYYVWVVPDFNFNPFLVIIYFIISLVIIVVTSFGMGSLLAAFNVRYRDFRYVIPFMIQFLMFVSPVIYPLTIFKDYPVLKSVMALNPLSGALTLARAGFLNTPVEWGTILLGMGSAFVLFFLGIFTFRKTEAYFADLA